jgi:uncharacterized membrane protein (UPF0127 family)
MDTTTISVGDRPLRAYVATTPREWRQGLSGRDLADVDGMLFRFGSDVHLAFAMSGMSVPILIAFFAADGAFISVTWLAVDARPYRPDQPYRYALELVGYHATTDGALALLPALCAGITLP